MNDNQAHKPAGSAPSAQPAPAEFQPYIEANKQAWATVAQAHYQTFLAFLSQHETTLNDTERQELGDISGKKILHLQCNTGADSISLAQAGLHILWLHEFDWLFYRLPVEGVYKDEQGHWQYPTTGRNYR